MNNRKTKSEFIDDMVAADGGIRGYHRAIRRKWAVLGILVIITVFMCLLSMNAGAATMTPIEVLKTLLGISGDERSFVVIWRLRMPRVVAAIVAGAGLSIAGCVMQTTLKNPLASPSTLGVSAGATFGANLAIILLGAGTVMNTASDAVAINNPYLVTFCAFACAFGAVILIMALSNLRGFTPESGRVSWSEVTILAVITFGVLIYFMFMRWNYNAMANGEETAKSLGVNTSRVRFWSMLSASLLTAVSVSFMGMIGFIGLIGPQIMKRIVGSDHRFLVPGSALLGSVILLAADTCARTVISPIILPVGAITSLLGAPMFFYMLLKGKRAK